MIIFAVRKTIQSTLYPGVTFVVRTMTEGVRNNLRSKLSVPLAKMREIQAKLESFDLPRNADGSVDNNGHVDASVIAEALNLHDQLGLIKANEINPSYVKVGFVLITGIQMDPGTAEDVVMVSPDPTNLMDTIPSDLYQEIVDTIRAEAELSAAERENLESPTISGAQVDGQSLVTIAPLAEETTCTKAEIVQDTILS